MKIQQVRDIVVWSASYHEELASEYRALANGSSDKRLSMVLDYLASHESEIEKGLKAYLDTAPAGLLATWSRTGPNLIQPKLLEELKTCLCCTSVADVTDLAVRIHATLGEMYDELVQAAEIDDQRELLASLRDHEEAETRRMVRDIGRFEAY